MGWFSKSTDDFFLSTTTPPNIGIDQYVGVVNGEAIIGANIFRDMFSSVRDVLGGREVVCSDGLTGVARGVDAGGALLVHTAAGVKKISSAEVSVRPASPY